MIGMTIVSICYFLVNLSFFSILSNDEIVSAQAVALVSAGLDFVEGRLIIQHMHGASYCSC